MPFMINNRMDTKEHLQRIRHRINESPQELTDEQALAVIERYVFSLPHSSGRSSRENGALIHRLFLMLRRELSILQPLADDPSVTEIMVNGANRVFV